MQLRHQLRLHELVFVWDVQANDSFTDQFLGILLSNPPKVLLFHYKNQIGPTKMTGIDSDPRPRLRTR